MYLLNLTYIKKLAEVGLQKMRPTSIGSGNTVRTAHFFSPGEYQITDVEIKLSPDASAAMKAE